MFRIQSTRASRAAIIEPPKEEEQHSIHTCIARRLPMAGPMLVSRGILSIKKEFYARGL